jgi:hypothetical protein
MPAWLLGFIDLRELLEEIEQVFLMARVMYKAVLGLHFKRAEQKKNGQLAIF